MLLRVCRLWALVGCLISSGSIIAQSVDFNRDVRPILADHCFQCHGPDAVKRQADLRLDQALDANREAGPVIVPGQPKKSELWRRLTSNDPEERMPPPDKGPRLSEAQLATLRQWIVEGGKFQKHWSLMPVRRPDVPPVGSSAIDAFVHSRLAKEGLNPAKEADKRTLLRRVTLALTGLPATPDQAAAFVADRSPDAYERVVDRLLASPGYGERMAAPWLDAARYADTSGYQSDGERYMWRWRDWVIDALNANMPFDQFTIEQLAGDLLPDAKLEQRIATGFNRNHRGNAEGGIIPEEYAVEYVADRVETTATVWLGLTLGCCRCHDHKYDPFSQRDFYRLFAFFNNVPEKGRAIKIGNSPPYSQAPTRLQESELGRLEEQFYTALKKFNELLDADQKHFLSWLLAAEGKRFGDWYPSEQLSVHCEFNDDFKERVTKGVFTAEGQIRFDSGRLGQAAQLNGQTWLSLSDVGNFGFFDKFTIAAWIKYEADGGGTVISRMADVPEGEGYQLAVAKGKLQLNLVKRWLDDALRVETESVLSPGEWHHICATYDGSREASGVKLYVDGKPQQLSVLLDELNQTFATKEPFRIGGGGGPSTRFRGLIDEVRVYATALSERDVKILATPLSIDEIIAGSNSDGSTEKLSQFYLLHHAPPELQAAEREQRQALRRFLEFDEKLPTVMVMEELPQRRPTHVLIRGQYDKPGDRVQPDVPAELPPMNASSPRNRLGLAQWLVSRENPLTSRVTVNRFWELYFGNGLVKTSEDFGRQGEWPSHPELLDWLAAEFMETGWNVKRMQRMVVTSATFRQGSGFGVQGSERVARDPENKLLARRPRLRSSAEILRDQALFASGLLVEQVGGPSVRPLQPAGLWSELTGGEDYKPGEGAELVRRSLYTFWKRTIPPPLLSTFDASSRETCIVRQARTNTPLQALALLNEPTFVAAAEALARRVMSEADSPEERIERAMLHVVGRKPTEEELSVLLAALERYRASGRDEPIVYTLVCSTILNLDEAVTCQ